MSLPFTLDQFLDVFARYNLAVGPAALALWVISAVMLLALVVAPGARRSRTAAALLAALWAWGGVGYHMAFFASINPAARGFAALFLIEAVLLAWFGAIRGRLSFGSAPRGMRALGVGFALYGLAYPGINLLLGHTYPRMPTFGVPCPTTIFTIGLLLTCGKGRPVGVVVVPVLWGLIGGSASFVLGVSADYALLLGSVVLTADALRRVRALQRGHAAGQPHLHERARAGRVADANRALEELHDLPRDGEAEPGAAGAP
jgi:hypothetical protein